jgi:hypothetical protein
MKLFRRLLNSTVLNALILYWENTGKRTEQLSYRVQLVVVEGLFVKYGCVVEHKVPGRHSSDNIVPRLVENISLGESRQQARSASHRDAPYAPSMGEGGTRYIGVRIVTWVSVSIVLRTTTPSSNSNVL